MPVKNTSQQQASGGADASPKKRKYSLSENEKKEKTVTVSFEVYQSEATTFQGIGEFRKAINSYTRVSLCSCSAQTYTDFITFLYLYSSLF